MFFHLTCFRKNNLSNEKRSSHETFKDLHQRAVFICSEKSKSLQRNFQRMFSILEVMIYNNLKSEEHMFRCSDQVFFTSRQNLKSIPKNSSHFKRARLYPYVKVFNSVFDMFKLYIQQGNFLNTLIKSKPKNSLPNVT